MKHYEVEIVRAYNVLVNRDPKIVDLFFFIYTYRDEETDSPKTKNVKLGSSSRYRE